MGWWLPCGWPVPPPRVQGIAGPEHWVYHEGYQGMSVVSVSGAPRWEDASISSFANSAEVAGAVVSMTKVVSSRPFAFNAAVAMSFIFTYVKVGAVGYAANLCPRGWENRSSLRRRVSSRA